ncbi:MAG: 6-phosphogluconolactonase [Cyanobacteria bacterium J06638_20]
MGVRRIEIFPDKAALVSRALVNTVEILEAAIAQTGRATIALAGGSTPKPLYAALAQQALPWDAIHVFWGDERYVPPTDADSNEGMARKAWLDQVPFPPDNIHPMPTDAVDPAIAAEQHNQHLQQFFQVNPGEFPALDLILLGMGDDGHTASLFPKTAALTVSDRLVTVGQKANQPRLTFTAPFINQAHHVMFLIAGADKQSALQNVLAPTGDATLYPSRLIQPQGYLYWLLDQSATDTLPAELLT